MSTAVREQCAPSEADWYVEVIYGKTFCDEHGFKCRRDACERRYGTETDYNYGYFKGVERPSIQDRDSLVPDGYVRRESTVKPCGR
ncbi:hypothetical protein ACJ6WD_10690 [Streptomyces sp. VTCC 41912]|uniref:hypothetical protein n=1 Tax=Streptomyces sp. VTCC 41912 TaxID=3383243 RepID=UPI003896D34C